MIKNETVKQASGSGIGFFELLTVLFIGLKLTGNIDWSWWWVFAPLWIPTAIVCLILIIWGFTYWMILVFEWLETKMMNK